MAMETRVAQALGYAKNGWHVLPLLPKSKVPHFDLVNRGYLSATTDTELVKFWFAHDKDINIGIACAQSELVVIDIDYRNGGKRTLDMTETYEVETGNGLHLYYRAPSDAQFKGTLGNGIDIKHKGYVVAAPSMHPNGKAYQVTRDIAPANIPATLLNQISRYAVSA